MLDGNSGSAHRTELLNVIRRVRNRWRLKLALRGVVIVVGGTLLALFLSASSLEALRFSPAAIIAFRVIAFGIFGALAYIGLVRPLQRRVTDSQVAMYLEECDPTLQSAILSAIESSSAIDNPTETGPSPRLVERLDPQAGFPGDPATKHQVAAVRADAQRCRIELYWRQQAQTALDAAKLDIDRWRRGRRRNGRRFGCNHGRRAFEAAFRYGDRRLADDLICFVADALGRHRAARVCAGATLIGRRAFK